MSKVLGFDHVSVVVKNAEASLKFYQSLLGLPLLKRPDLGFSGYWLDLFSGQSLHIMELSNPCEGLVRPKHGGRDFHFALQVSSVDDYVGILEEKKVSYTWSLSGRKALFMRDIDDNAFELFEACKNA